MPATWWIEKLHQDLLTHQAKIVFIYGSYLKNAFIFSLLTSLLKFLQHKFSPLELHFQSSTMIYQLAESAHFPLVFQSP